MEEDKSTLLKRFGFLPNKELTVEQQKVKPRPRVKRYYLRDVENVYLTGREAEVSWHLSRGCTVREAAYRMELSPRTAEFYLGNVRRKLGVRNKRELLQLLFENDFFQCFCDKMEFIE